MLFAFWKILLAAQKKQRLKRAYRAAGEPGGEPGNVELDGDGSGLGLSATCPSPRILLRPSASLCWLPAFGRGDPIKVAGRRTVKADVM